MEKKIDIVHNYNRENLLMMVFGGYAFLKKPISHFILNAIWSLSDFLLHLFTITMSAITLTFPSIDKGTAIQLGQTLCLLFATFAVRGINFYSSNGLKAASEILDCGVFVYGVEDADENEIKKSRVSQIRFIIKLYTLMILSIWALTSFLIPFLKWILSSSNDQIIDEMINPYLPQPIYMPFNTRSVYGYCVAFLSNVLCFFTIFVSFICHISLTISYALQFTAQMEVLKHSLKNIENRARLKLLKKDLAYGDVLTQSLYHIPDFQKCLYSCLRENALHHQELLR